MGKKAADVWSNLGDIATSALDSVADSLADTMMRAEVNWRSLGRSVIKEVLAMIVKLQMLAIWQAITGTSGMGGGGGNIGAGPSTALALPSGGSTGMVPELAEGGYVGQTGWAKVHKGETYSGVEGQVGGMTVNVINNAGVEVQIEENKDERTYNVILDAIQHDGAMRTAVGLD